MVQKVSEIMTPEPVAVRPAQSLSDAALAMRDYGIGTVLVVEKGRLEGVVTDRDIVVRAIANGRDPDFTPVSEICSKDNMVTAMPGEDADVAVLRMREHGVRRIPVVEAGGRAVGVVSIGDMAIERDDHSVLADISAQPPNY